MQNDFYAEKIAELNAVKSISNDSLCLIHSQFTLIRRVYFSHTLNITHDSVSSKLTHIYFSETILYVQIEFLRTELITEAMIITILINQVIISGI